MFSRNGGTSRGIRSRSCSFRTRNGVEDDDGLLIIDWIVSIINIVFATSCVKEMTPSLELDLDVWIIISLIVNQLWWPSIPSTIQVTSDGAMSFYEFTYDNILHGILGCSLHGILRCIHGSLGCNHCSLHILGSHLNKRSPWLLSVRPIKTLPIVSIYLRIHRILLRSHLRILRPCRTAAAPSAGHRCRSLRPPNYQPAWPSWRQQGGP